MTDKISTAPVMSLQQVRDALHEAHNSPGLEAVLDSCVTAIDACLNAPTPDVVGGDVVAFRIIGADGRKYPWFDAESGTPEDVINPDERIQYAYSATRVQGYAEPAEVTDKQIRCIAACIADARYVSHATARNEAFLKTLRNALFEASSTACPKVDYPECSGDTSSCPENEGYGCCGAKSQPSAQPKGDDLLVTMQISVDRDGKVDSDIQTHDNSYSDVAVGLAACRNEIQRVFDERKSCPYYPKSICDSRTPIIRHPAEQTRGDAHPDDVAVDAFAVALKAKLAEARAKGRGGWNGDEPGMQQRLSDMLRAHVEKGDPRDVANFAMFLHQRGESILPAEQTRGDGVTMLSLAQEMAQAYTEDFSTTRFGGAEFMRGCFGPSMHALLKRIVSEYISPRQAVPDEVAKDAARYRFLKANFLDKWVDAKTNEPSSCGFNFEGTGHDIDAQIDATMLAYAPSAGRMGVDRG